MIRYFRHCTAYEGDHIVSIGDEAQFFFIIGNGECDVIFNGNKKVRTLYNGDAFGDLSLIFEAKRNATIKAVSETHLWAIHKKIFNKFINKVKLEKY